MANIGEKKGEERENGERDAADVKVESKPGYVCVHGLETGKSSKNLVHVALFTES